MAGLVFDGQSFHLRMKGGEGTILERYTQIVLFKVLVEMIQQLRLLLNLA